MAAYVVGDRLVVVAEGLDLGVPLGVVDDGPVDEYDRRTLAPVLVVRLDVVHLDGRHILAYAHIGNKVVSGAVSGGAVPCRAML